MQTTLAILILLGAFAILWKHFAPNTLRTRANRALQDIVRKAGWRSLAEKLAKKPVSPSNCTACSRCSQSEPQPSCEIRISPESIKRL